MDYDRDGVSHTRFNFLTDEHSKPTNSILICESMSDAGCTSEELHSKSCYSEMLRGTELHRRHYCLHDNQRLLVGLAWIYRDEQRLFRLFPKVVTKRVAHGGKFEPRAKLKAAFEEVLSVMEGCDQQEFFADKVIAVLADVVASMRSTCHENISGGKRPAVVSFNREKEPKRSRQYVANNGIR